MLKKFQIPIIVGNWKMNPQGADEAKKKYNEIVKKLVYKSGTVVIAPPIVYLRDLYASKKGQNSALFLGVQDVFYEQAGAFTGKISPDMAVSNGAAVALIGHSEMRSAGDTDDVVNAKIHAALSARLFVIICIGEKERNDEGVHFEFIKNQLIRTLRGIKKEDASRICIAYEPVWAIGTGTSINSTDLHEMTLYIRKQLALDTSLKVFSTVPILYGGSVTPENAADFIIHGNADGLLIGKQSLDPGSFVAIYDSVSRVKKTQVRSK